MEEESEDRWQELCLLVRTEKDPRKLFELVTEINQLLKEKQRLLG